MKSRLLLLLVVTLLALTSLVVKVSSDPEPLFVIYGSLECPNCRRILKEVGETYGNQSILFFDITNSKNLDRAFQILDLVYEGEETPETPLVGVFWNNSLLAVTFGYTPLNFWFEVLNNTQRETVLIAWEGQIIGNITDEELISALERIFMGIQKEEKPPTISNEKTEKSLIPLLLGIILAAAADSVNPCVFSIFVVLMILSVQTAGKRGGTKVGLAFIITVYVSYLLLGLGLRAVLSRLLASYSWIIVLIGVGAIALGGYEVFSAIITPFKSVLPEPLKRITAERLEEIGSKASVVGAFGLGILLSFTLLPCSWGPYLVTIGLIAGLSAGKQILVLLLYNFIFVLPLIAVLVAINIFGVKIRTLKYWRGTKFPIMKLFAGILLIAVGTYAILHYII
ncbi:MAG TPA: cytochrome c biogenesis protein CcdA [Candidatus Korarchaeota archaeon]|nr:cytochrome c biogenesis protein CcdA [Candidatus Korarchaeota archaeon]